MLCLTRKVEETICAGNIIIKVLAIDGNKVKLGIAAPREIPVHRGEVAERIAAEKARKQVDLDLKELHDAGLSAWDWIPDPEAYIQNLRGE